MTARLTPNSLSGHEARFVLRRVRGMIAQQRAVIASARDNLAALEVVAEIISSSVDAAVCGIPVSSQLEPD